MQLVAATRKVLLSLWEVCGQNRKPKRKPLTKPTACAQLFTFGNASPVMAIKATQVPTDAIRIFRLPLLARQSSYDILPIRAQTAPEAPSVSDIPARLEIAMLNKPPRK